MKIKKINNLITSYDKYKIFCIKTPYIFINPDYIVLIKTVTMIFHQVRKEPRAAMKKPRISST